MSQLVFDMPVTVEQASGASGSRAWVGTPSKLTDMVNAVVGRIPLVANRRGTAREHWRRPVAYVYARPDSLSGGDADTVGVMAWSLAHSQVRGPRSTGAWSRVNGEREGATSYDAHRDVRRDFRRKTHDWAWLMDVSRRATPEHRAAYKRGRAELEAAGVARGSLEYLVLLTHWSPAVAVAVRWTYEGLEVGSDDWLERMDRTLDAGAEGELAGVGPDFARLSLRARTNPGSPLAVALRDHGRIDP